MATTKPTADVREPDCHKHGHRDLAVKLLGGKHSEQLQTYSFSYPYSSNCQAQLHEGQTTALYFCAPSEETCVNLCGPFEASLICRIKSSMALMLEKAKANTLELYH